MKCWKLWMWANLLCPRVQQSLSRHSIFLLASSEKSAWLAFWQHEDPQPWATTAFSHYYFYSHYYIYSHYYSYSHYYGGARDQKNRKNCKVWNILSELLPCWAAQMRQRAVIPATCSTARSPGLQARGNPRRVTRHPPAAVIGFLLSHHHRNTRVYPLFLKMVERAGKWNTLFGISPAGISPTILFKTSAS